MEQKFNYHTHTSRSGHSEFITDEEILEASINSGLTTIGFSEHLANPNTIIPDEDERMLYSEIDEYITSINILKEQYPNINILVGFEAEYEPMKEAYFGNMKEKVDYMVLGQRFVKKDLGDFNPINNPNYPIQYANIVIKALDTGIFDMVSHPDIFMKYRDTMESEESKKLFKENAMIASQIICEKAKEMSIPIEINLGSNRKILSDGCLEYPHPWFWKVASEINGLQVLYGLGIHSLDDFKNLDEMYSKVSNITSMVQDKLVNNNYNPVIARESNETLKKSYQASQSKALSFETHMANGMLKSCLNNNVDELNKDTLAQYITNYINYVSQSCEKAAEEKNNKTLEESTVLNMDTNISNEYKLGKLNRKRRTIKDTKNALTNQIALIENVKNAVINSMKMGCTSKEEIINIATQLIAHNTTLSEKQKVQIEMQVNRYARIKNSMGTGGSTYTFTKRKHGFSNIISIALILMFIFGFGVGIAYTLIQIG